MNRFKKDNSIEYLENVYKSDTSVEVEGQIQKKIPRKGEIICYTKRENINMLDKSSDRNIKQKETCNYKDLDGSSSDQLTGESAYKTYIFEENEKNDMELEKCIAFWKSVMERNLKPIKCTIIDNKKRQDSKEDIEPVKEYSYAEEINEAVEQTKESVHAEYKKMLMKAVDDIQHLKLESVKLIGKARCKLCDAIEKPIEEYSTDPDSDTIKKELESLNTWKSVSSRKRVGDRYRSRQKSSRTIQEKCADPNECEGKKEEMDRTVKHKFVNIIEQKKRNGAYSKWRDNLVKAICLCGKLKCECNTNPAIKSIKRIQGVSNESINTQNLDKVEKEIIVEASNDIIVDNENEKRSETFSVATEPSLDEESELLQINKTAVILPAKDSAEDSKSVQQETILPEKEFGEEAINLNTNTLVQQTDTQAILEVKKIRSSTQELETPRNSLSDKSASSVESYGILKNKYQNTEYERASISIPMERTVSVILPKTGKVEIIRRETVDDTNWEKPQRPSSSVSLQGARSSIEAIKEKLGKPRNSFDKYKKSSSTKMISEKIKSADDVHRQGSGKKTLKKKSDTSHSKVAKRDSYQLEILHHKDSNSHDVSKVFTSI